MVEKLGKVLTKMEFLTEKEIIDTLSNSLEYPSSPSMIAIFRWTSVRLIPEEVWKNLHGNPS